MTRKPAAYLRRSSADTNSPGTVSRESQQAAVERMAAADGADSPEVFVDWGLSGGKADRPDYVRLKEAIGADRVSKVYALNLSRLGRSLPELIAFTELCAEHEVELQLAQDGINTATATGELSFNMLASVSQFTRKLAEEAGADSLKVRRARGDVLGAPRYGQRFTRGEGGRIELEADPDRPMEPLLAAYREADSIAGACRLLNARGIKSARGKDWGTSSLRAILRDNAPDMLPPVTPGLRRARPSMLLSGLLKCHCGTTLTPTPGRSRYYCFRSRSVQGHGKATIAESKLVEWVKNEAARLRVPPVTQADNQAERDELRAERERTLLLFRKGHIPEDQLDTDMAELDAQLAALDDTEALLDLPEAIDWDWPPEAINGVLRAMWTHVQLDDDLLPREAVWRVPEWRNTPPDA
jgi:DNA invertase Pin-like site-specific DNA recombinase